MKNISIYGLAALLCCISACKHDSSAEIQLKPVLTASVSEGEPGTHVTIQGSVFSSDPAKNEIDVSGVPARIVHSSATSLEFILPETHTAFGNINVHVNHSVIGRSQPFHYHDVYISGRVHNTYPALSYIVLWKNGVLQPISFQHARFSSFLSSYSTSLAVDNGNVYLNAVDGYYKNNTFVSQPGGNGSDIKIKDGSVYTTSASGYFKDDVFHRLSLPIFTINTHNVMKYITLKGNDIYVAGSNDNGAFYYKNDINNELSTIKYSSAEAIKVSKGIVVVVGNIGSTPTLWLDGVASNPADMTSIGSLTDVLHVGDDRYISCWFSPLSAAYIKDGVLAPTIFQYSFHGTRLATVGSTIYAAGQSFTPLGPTADAAYYRNSSLVILDKGQYDVGIADDIVIVKR